MSDGNEAGKSKSRTHPNHSPIPTLTVPPGACGSCERRRAGRGFVAATHRRRNGHDAEFASGPTAPSPPDLPRRQARHLALSGSGGWPLGDGRHGGRNPQDPEKGSRPFAWTVFRTALLHGATRTASSVDDGRTAGGPGPSSTTRHETITGPFSVWASPPLQTGIRRALWRSTARRGTSCSCRDRPGDNSPRSDPAGNRFFSRGRPQPGVELWAVGADY